jgi:phenylalanyl-tRNA synthetase beta chain
MQKRLKAIGINPKNMLVDVTNYISFDRCRPLHVYDASEAEGRCARASRHGSGLVRGA